MTAVTTGYDEHKLRVIAPSVGGAFGSKLDVYAEELIAVALARKLGVPVRWTEDRSENAVATVQGRGQIQDIELAADADGKITAVRVHLLVDMGAYLQLVTPGIPLLGAFLYHGAYDIPLYSFECTGVFTNKTPTDAYRGAGRPGSHLRHRARHRGARRQGGRQPRRDPPPQLHQARAVPVHVVGRAVVRLRRLRDGTRSGARSHRLRRRSARTRPTGGRPAPRSTSVSACRRTSRCAASRRPVSSRR